mmetsp:Transcript_3808/g.5186  ORF Transcript_3808/g.5186 Transcript_3808/m.5186 type:complete len:579 (-) Transcript_3808:87-1823(-)
MDTVRRKVSSIPLTRNRQSSGPPPSIAFAEIPPKPSFIRTSIINSLGKAGASLAVVATAAKIATDQSSKGIPTSQSRTISTNKTSGVKTSQWTQPWQNMNFWKDRFSKSNENVSSSYAPSSRPRPTKVVVADPSYNHDLRNLRSRIRMKSGFVGGRGGSILRQGGHSPRTPSKALNLISTTAAAADSISSRSSTSSLSSRSNRSSKGTKGHGRRATGPARTGNRDQNFTKYKWFQGASQAMEQGRHFFQNIYDQNSKQSETENTDTYSRKRPHLGIHVNGRLGTRGRSEIQPNRYSSVANQRHSNHKDTASNASSKSSIFFGKKSLLNNNKHFPLNPLIPYHNQQQRHQINTCSHQLLFSPMVQNPVLLPPKPTTTNFQIFGFNNKMNSYGNQIDLESLDDPIDKPQSTRLQSHDDDWLDKELSSSVNPFKPPPQISLDDCEASVDSDMSDDSISYTYRDMFINIQKQKLHRHSMQLERSSRLLTRQKTSSFTTLSSRHHDESQISGLDSRLTYILEEASLNNNDTNTKFVPTFNTTKLLSRMKDEKTRIDLKKDLLKSSPAIYLRIHCGLKFMDRQT